MSLMLLLVSWKEFLFFSFCWSYQRHLIWVVLLYIFLQRRNWDLNEFQSLHQPKMKSLCSFMISSSRWKWKRNKLGELLTTISPIFAKIHLLGCFGLINFSSFKFEVWNALFGWSSLNNINSLKILGCTLRCRIVVEPLKLLCRGESLIW